MIPISGGISGTIRRHNKRPFPNYVEDPNIGQIREHGAASDTSYFNALQSYLAKEPGFDPEALRALTDIPTEQSKYEESGALRRLNQGAAFRGGYGSGATGAGRARIMSEGMRQRGNIVQQARLYAAQAALQDRLNQLSAADRYSTSRLSMGLGETGRKNQFNMGMNELALRKWLATGVRYNVQAGYGGGGGGGGGTEDMSGAFGGGGGGGYFGGYDIGNGGYGY